jgi:hypothetical protein
MLGKCNDSKRIKSTLQLTARNPSNNFLFRLTNLILGRENKVNRIRTRYQIKRGIPIHNSAKPL